MDRERQVQPDKNLAGRANQRAARKPELVCRDCALNAQAATLAWKIASCCILTVRPDLSKGVGRLGRRSHGSEAQHPRRVVGGRGAFQPASQHRHAAGTACGTSHPLLVVDRGRRQARVSTVHGRLREVTEHQTQPAFPFGTFSPVAGGVQWAPAATLIWALALYHLSSLTHPPGGTNSR